MDSIFVMMSTKPKKQPGGSPCNNLKLNTGPHEHGQRDGERGLDLEGLQVFGAPLHRQHGPQEGEALRAKFEKIIRNLANVVIVKKVRLSLGLNGSNFEAKGGIVGGSVNVGRINTLCQLNEDMDVEPFHKLGLQVGIIYYPFPTLIFNAIPLN